MNEPSVVPARQTPALWDQLSAEQAIRLQVLVGQFQATQERMTRDLFVLTETLAQVKAITGENFYAFAEQQMGIRPRTIRRYMHIHTVLEAHFQTNGRIDPVEMRNFTQRAFDLLGPDTDDGIILELRTIAQAGQSVDEKTVKKLLETRDGDLQTEVASLQAEIKTVRQEASAGLNRLQVENATLITQDQNTRELVRKLTEQRSALDLEMDELRRQTVQVQYVDKEILPAGYLSAAEAIKDATAKKEEIEGSIVALQQKKNDLESQIQFVTAGAEEFLNMKEQVDGFLLKFPVAMIRAVSSTDQAIKQHIEVLSACMLQFGHQLQKAIT